jgi:hypothetical protein
VIVTFTAIMLATLLAALDQTIVAAARVRRARAGGRAADPAAARRYILKTP